MFPSSQASPGSRIEFPHCVTEIEAPVNISTGGVELPHSAMTKIKSCALVTVIIEVPTDNAVILTTATRAQPGAAPTASAHAGMAGG